MSDNAVESEQKKMLSPVFKWILVILALVVLESGAIVSAVKISESKNQTQSDDIQMLKNKTSANEQHLAQLQRFQEDIATNSQKIAENTGKLQLYNENFNTLKNEVGNQKIEILTRQIETLSHRMETVEETKNREALVLSLALIIKENALYNRSFAKEAAILETLSHGQDKIAEAVQTINTLKNVQIASDTQLIKEYHAFAENFNFDTAETNGTENNEDTEKSTVSKSIDIIKDTVAGINFDKVVVLNKDRKTPEEKLLMQKLAELVSNHNFSKALAFIEENPKFKKTQNKALNTWINNVQQKITFDEAISFIIATELNAMRQDFKTMVLDEIAE